jgi:hypothetical protein
MIHRHFYTPTSHSLRFQKKLYPDLIVCGDMINSAISSTFGFEGLSQKVLSVILSYVDIRSARNMLPVSNLFYFGIRDCLTHCHKSVFEMYRTTFIGQLLPLFTQIESFNDKIDILQILCSIRSNSIDHALDILSIFNTFNPGNLKDTLFVQQFGDLIYGLYLFAPCISTREYYYLLHPFIQHLLPPAISHADPLKPFESSILSNKFSFDHFRGYMNSFLSLMKKKRLTASALGLDETDIRRMPLNFNYWGDIIWEDNEESIYFIFA